MKNNELEKQYKDLEKLKRELNTLNYKINILKGKIKSKKYDIKKIKEKNKEKINDIIKKYLKTMNSHKLNKIYKLVGHLLNKEVIIFLYELDYKKNFSCVDYNNLIGYMKIEIKYLNEENPLHDLKERVSEFIKRSLPNDNQ